MPADGAAPCSWARSEARMGYAAARTAPGKRHTRPEKGAGALRQPEARKLIRDGSSSPLGGYSAKRHRPHLYEGTDAASISAMRGKDHDAGGGGVRHREYSAPEVERIGRQSIRARRGRKKGQEVDKPMSSDVAPVERGHAQAL